MRRWRVGLSVAGIAFVLFGVFRLVTNVAGADLVALTLWLLAAVVIHDGFLSPLLVVIGVVVARVPARARRYVQITLIVSGLLAVIALPLIARRGSQPDVKALLLQDYALHFALLVGGISALALVLYATRVLRDRHNGQR
jgi:hypothetical protein